MINSAAARISMKMNGGVRAAALRLLGKLAPEELAHRSNVIVARLEDREQSVRTVALDVMARLSPADLAAHKPSLASGLEDEVTMSIPMAMSMAMLTSHRSPQV